MTAVITTERLLLRPWAEADAGAALGIFGDGAGAVLLPPGDRSVDDEPTMRAVLRRWRSEGHEAFPAGHWAVEERDSHRLVGACALSYGAPGPESLKLLYALHPAARGHGYATEAGIALVRWAIHEGGVIEVFAVVQPDNPSAQATARRIGMEWVSESGHYPGGGSLQVYRIKHGDLAYQDSSSSEDDHSHADPA